MYANVGVVSDASAASAPTKPLLRGVSHEVAFYVSLAGTALLAHTATGAHDAAARHRALFAALVYGASLAAQLGVSALYHRVTWSAAARARMRRLDHAAIFVLIAGSYTPLFTLVPDARGDATHAATIVWLGAALGVVKSLVWPHAPKWLTALVCVALGWAVIGQVVARAPAVGWTCVGLLVASGVVYSAGASVYALKRPNPLPATFGYHEVFHALVVAASALVYAHVTLVVSAYLAVLQTVPSPAFVQ